MPSEFSASDRQLLVETTIYDDDVNVVNSCNNKCRNGQIWLWYSYGKVAGHMFAFVYAVLELQFKPFEMG
jgi:hypothetical protein